MGIFSSTPPPPLPGKIIKLIVGIGNPGKFFSNTRHNAGLLFLDHLSQKYKLQFQKSPFGGEIAFLNSESLLLAPSFSASPTFYTPPSSIPPSSLPLSSSPSLPPSSSIPPPPISAAPADASRSHVPFSTDSPFSSSSPPTSSSSFPFPSSPILANNGSYVAFFRSDAFMNMSGDAVKAAIKYCEIEDLKNIIILHDDLDTALGTVKFKSSGSAEGHRGVLSITSTLSSKNIPRLKIGIGRPNTRDPLKISLFVTSSFNQAEIATLQNDGFRKGLIILEEKGFFPKT